MAYISELRSKLVGPNIFNRFRVDVQNDDQNSKDLENINSYDLIDKKYYARADHLLPT